jgi:hypothetical protein
MGYYNRSNGKFGIYSCSLDPNLKLNYGDCNMNMDMGLEKYTWVFLLGFGAVMIIVIGLFIFWAKSYKDE